MRVGDLVELRADNSMRGIVVDVNHWVDKGAPDRNFGTNIYVAWHDSTCEYYDEWELVLVNESR